MAGSGITMLETPPWIIALAFMAFIALTFVFEKIIHYLIHFLEERQKAKWHALHHPADAHDQTLKKRGKHHNHTRKKGMLTAFEGLVAELTALGFASLMLISFQNDITSLCVRPEKYLKGYRWLDFVDDDPCCLADTKYTTPCFFAYRDTSEYAVTKECKAGGLPSSFHLAGEQTSGYYKVNATGGIAPFPPAEFKLEDKYAMTETATAKKYHYKKCYREVQLGWEECGKSQNLVPAIGLKALHEVHLYIFFIAACHICTTIVLICTAFAQAALWKHWLRSPSSANVLSQTQKIVDAHCAQVASRRETAQVEGQYSSPEELRRSSDGYATDEAPTASLTENPGLRSISLNLDAPFTPFDEANGLQMAPTIHISRNGGWNGKNSSRWSIMQSLRRLIRQFFPLAVSKNELEVLQASFLMTHEIETAHQFSFMAYLQYSVEDDFAGMAGLRILNWLFITCYLLLTCAVGLMLWPIFVLAGGLQIFLATKFINIVWNSTTGGNVHKQSDKHFFLGRPWVYSKLIQFTAFLVAFIFANELFFATQYGPDSCFFTSGFSRYGAWKIPVSFPWWGFFLINLYLLIVLAGVIAPLFSIVVHQGRDYKPALFPEALQKHLLQLHKAQNRIDSGTGNGFLQSLHNFVAKAVKPKARASMHVVASAAGQATQKVTGAAAKLASRHSSTGHTRLA